MKIEGDPLNTQHAPHLYNTDPFKPRTDEEVEEGLSLWRRWWRSLLAKIEGDPLDTGGGGGVWWDPLNTQHVQHRPVEGDRDWGHRGGSRGRMMLPNTGQCCPGFVHWEYRAGSASYNT